MKVVPATAAHVIVAQGPHEGEVDTLFLCDACHFEVTSWYAQANAEMWISEPL